MEGDDVKVSQANDINAFLFSYKSILPRMYCEKKLYLFVEKRILNFKTHLFCFQTLKFVHFAIEGL